MPYLLHIGPARPPMFTQSWHNCFESAFVIHRGGALGTSWSVRISPSYPTRRQMTNVQAQTYIVPQSLHVLSSGEFCHSYIHHKDGWVSNNFKVMNNLFVIEDSDHRGRTWIGFLSWVPRSVTWKETSLITCGLSCLPDLQYHRRRSMMNDDWWK